MGTIGTAQQHLPSWLSGQRAGQQQRLGHLPERGSQNLSPWQANGLCPPSAAFLNFLGEEDSSVFK